MIGYVSTCSKIEFEEDIMPSAKNARVDAKKPRNCAFFLEAPSYNVFLICLKIWKFNFFENSLFIKKKILCKYNLHFWEDNKQRINLAKSRRSRSESSSCVNFHQSNDAGSDLQYGFNRGVPPGLGPQTSGTHLAAWDARLAYRVPRCGANKWRSYTARVNSWNPQSAITVYRYTIHGSRNENQT